MLLKVIPALYKGLAIVQCVNSGDASYTWFCKSWEFLFTV